MPRAYGNVPQGCVPRMPACRHAGLSTRRTLRPALWRGPWPASHARVIASLGAMHRTTTWRRRPCRDVRWRTGCWSLTTRRARKRLGMDEGEARRLQPKVALVTGAARDMGGAIAERLAQAGADGVVADMRDTLASE